MKKLFKWARSALALCALAALLAGCARQATVTSIDPPITQPTVAPVAQEPYIAPAQPDLTGSTGDMYAANPLSGDGGTGAYPANPNAPIQDTSTQRGAINVGMVLTAEAGLHPLKCQYRDLISLNALVFESLVELDDKLQPQPQLSDRWTFSGNTCTFHLRKSVSFHNGAPLTPNDVIASYSYIKTVGSSSPWYDRMSNISNMEAGADGETVVVTFAAGGYAALYAMTFPIVQQGTLDYARPMGTGPYWYIAYSVNQYLRLESNPLWWKKVARAQSIMAYRYEDTAAALEALLTGEIDTLATRSAQASLYKKLSNYSTMEYSTLCYEFLVPNLVAGPMTDLRVRQAFLYAIDRTSLANTVYGGMVQESEVPVIPGSWLYETQATQFNYSPERALQLLYDVGWKDSNGDGMLDVEVDGLLENFTIRLVTYDDPTSESRTDAAKLIAAQLKKIGVEVRVVTASKANMSTVFKKGEFDVALIAVNLPFVPDLTELLRHDGDQNYSGYANKDMNNLISSARNAVTAEQLQNIYSEIQLKVIDELPILGLYFKTGAVISAAAIRSLHGLMELDTYNGMELVKP